MEFVISLLLDLHIFFPLILLRVACVLLCDSALGQNYRP